MKSAAKTGDVSWLLMLVNQVLAGVGDTAASSLANTGLGCSYLQEFRDSGAELEVERERTVERVPCFWHLLEGVFAPADLGRLGHSQPC